MNNNRFFLPQSNRYHGYSRENGKAILGAFFLVKERQIVLRTIGGSGSEIPDRQALRKGVNNRTASCSVERESPNKEKLLIDNRLFQISF